LESFSRDPIGFKGSKHNLYEFFDSHALIKLDPDGLKTVNCTHIPPATRVGAPEIVAVGMGWDVDMNNPDTNPLPANFTIMYWLACTKKTKFSFTYTCACPCKPPSNIPIFSTETVEDTVDETPIAKIHVPGGIAVLNVGIDTKWGGIDCWTLGNCTGRCG